MDVVPDEGPKTLLFVEDFNSSLRLFPSTPAKDFNTWTLPVPETLGHSSGGIYLLV